MTNVNMVLLLHGSNENVCERLELCPGQCDRGLIHQVQLAFYILCI